MADTRILLVDDEKEVTALLAKRLVRRGYQCDTAADGLQAVEAMSEGAFGYLMKPVDFDELLFKIEDAAMQSRLEGPESDMAR